MTTDELMPGVMPALYDTELKWHAIQVTIGEWATEKGKSVEATIQCKTDKTQVSGDCALMLKMKLQGRSRNTRKQEYDLTELCLQYGEIPIRDFMLEQRARLGSEVTEIASADNPTWKQAYLRSGFGRGGMAWEDKLHRSQQNRNGQTQWGSRGDLDARSHRWPL
jgi:hypothetical protein